MVVSDIKHFLVIYNIGTGKADVREFETDYDQALRAYDDCEQSMRNQPNVEVVLLSAESLDTIKRTHSSYFQTGRLDELLPA
jgi:outer membrane protein TolC